jgi:hypothetical protein
MHGANPKGATTYRCACGNRKGLRPIPDELLIFKSDQTTGDYEKMSSDNYMRWFQEKIFRNLRHNFDFVIENAAYH